MLDFTLYSFMWVIFTTSICLLIYMAAVYGTKFAAKIPMGIVVLFTAALSLRLFIPAEFLKISRTFTMYKIFPAVDEVMRKKILTNDFFGGISIISVFFAVWGIGSAVMLLCYFASWCRLCRIIKFMPQIDGNCLRILEKLKAEKGYNFKTKIIQSNAVDFPAECGYFSQTIFLNDYEYTEGELKYILMHELAHYKYGTNWLNLFVSLLNIIFWWNPVIYLYRKYVDNFIEIYVDSKVTKNMTDAEKCSYMKCIFNVYQIISGRNMSAAKHVNPLIADKGEKLLLKRFKIIKSADKINIPMCALTLFLILTYVFVSCGFVVQPGWKCPVPNYTELEIDFNADNSYIVFENNRYILYYNGESFLEVDRLDDFPNVPVK